MLNDLFQSVNPAALLPSVLLVFGWMMVMRMVRYSGWGIALVGLAGTWLHEMSHFVVGFILGARPVSFSIWPRREGRNWILGAVGFTRLNIFNSAFVAFAPLLLLGISAVTMLYWTIPALEAGSYGSWGISGYIVACCFFSCMPSSTDIKVGALSALMYTGLGYLVWQALR